jgi:anti-sigma regulatory factor (Ser/Thr protein kinase)
MIVCAKTFDQIRQAIIDGRDAVTFVPRFTGITVGAAFDCCCAGWFWEQAQVSNGLSFLEEIQSRFPALEVISSALKNGRKLIQDSEEFSPLMAELRTLQNREELSSDAFGLFQMRFSRSLENAGFGKELGRAIAVALGEMADNIVQHANQLADVHGIVAYQVSSRAMCFAVADVGQGILKSFSKTPTWCHLSTDRDALLAAVQQGATSRQSVREGAGFKQVHRSLASCNGFMRFRSGKGVLTLTGDAESKKAISGSVAAMGGFQLFVSCDLDQRGENFLLDSFH